MMQIKRYETGIAERLFCFTLASIIILFSSFQFSLNVFADDSVNKDELTKAVSDAGIAKEDINISSDGKDVYTDELWAAQKSFTELNNAIAKANKVLKDDTATQKDVDDETTALNEAIKKFKNACAKGTKVKEENAGALLVKEVFMKTDDPGSDGKTHFVGEDFDAKYKTLSITGKGKTLQLNGYYQTSKNDGVMHSTADSATPLGPVLLSWKSSDISVATVSNDGLITPIKDGDVTISATVTEGNKYKGNPPTKKVKIEISGQTGEYVESVVIIDEDGNSLSSKNYTSVVVDGKNKFYQLRALVTWYDPKTDKKRVEDTRKDSVTSTITWSVGGSSVAGTINKDTGRFKSGEYSGNCYVTCQVTGGLAGKTMSDKAYIQVDTGEYAYNPAKSLTLKVVYQEFPDKVVQEHTYSLSELSSKLKPTTNSYTIIGGDRFGTIRASGYLFKDILALEDVHTDDVFQYKFKTADGYDNPITSKQLFDSGKRYYFPDYDIGYKTGGVVVPPILAYSSNMQWNEAFIPSDIPLDEGTRFRLVFGALYSGESNSSFQIYYIQGITIVLKGAPPADSGTGNGKGSGNGSGGGGAGSGSGAGNGTGSGTGDGNGNGSGKGSVGGGTESGNAGTVGNAGKKGNSNFSGGKGNDPGDSGGRLKMYEMISNSKSNVKPLNVDLPLLPYAIPIACGGVVAGSLTYWVSYMRRLR